MEGSDEDDKHSAIVSSYSSTSMKDGNAMVNMADLSEEISKRLKIKTKS